MSGRPDLDNEPSNITSDEYKRRFQTAGGLYTIVNETLIDNPQLAGYLHQNSKNYEYLQRIPLNCPNILSNGHFESESESGWIFGEETVRPSYINTFTQEGERSILLGILPDTPNDIPTTSSIRQLVTIPNNTTSAELRWWKLLRTAQGGAVSQFTDHQDLTLLSSNLQPIQILRRELRNDSVWLEDVVDLTPYRGQTLYIEFSVFNDSNNTPTWMYLDNVRLRVCGDSIETILTQVPDVIMPSNRQGDGSVTLLAPLDTLLLGRQTFSWSTNMTLAEKQYFELVFWPAGSDPLAFGFGLVGATKKLSINIDLDRIADSLPQFFYPQVDYQWGILLVELQPYKRLAFLGGGHLFRFERTSSSLAVLTPTPAVTAQPTAPSFIYGVTVKDDATNQPIANAKVRIEVEGTAPLDEYADSNGFARLFIPAALAERPGRLTVEADGYAINVRNIDLWPDRLPNEVRLTPE